MKLFLLQDRGWDKMFQVVRAESLEQAKELAREEAYGFNYPDDDMELTLEGDPGVIWEFSSDGPTSE